ncbi:hypothetical protein [Streptomyces sp. NPDC015345]|uniref:hypothetical protein n=1 Tax=Streptomyces sp. NPDC015345 TaxID=3364953 RepID=UPI0036FD3AE2
MQPEVLSACIGGGGALLGVALGIAGTLRAARTHGEAARDAAATQATATLRQQAREARRPVYAGALAAGRAYKTRAELLIDGSATPDALDDVAAEVEAAVALVELEGPRVLESAAIHLLQCATQLGRYVIDHRDLLRAQHVIATANRTPDGLTPEQVRAANTLEIAFGLLAVTAQKVDPQWRPFLATHHSTAEPERQQALGRWAARPNMPPPPSSADQAALLEALSHARDSIAEALRAELLTVDQARELLRYCVHEGRVIGPRDPQFEAATWGLHRALIDFRTKARAVLHDGEDPLWGGAQPPGA